jgi:hypothetical protein
VNPSASNFGLGGEFDAFLFAPIGEDRNGLPLRIVSLLGRLDLDPWQAAASLAALPAETAALKLASLLAELPVAQLKQADPGSMAADLVALLPRRTHLVPRSFGSVRAGDTVHPRIVMHAMLFGIWLIWLLGMEAFLARHDVPTHADTAQTSAAPIGPIEKSSTTAGERRSK